MHLTVEALSFLIAVAFLAGATDALAGGGGLLTIPALLASGVPPIAALATNKLQSTVGTASAPALSSRGKLKLLILINQEIDTRTHKQPADRYAPDRLAIKS